MRHGFRCMWLLEPVRDQQWRRNLPPIFDDEKEIVAKGFNIDMAVMQLHSQDYSNHDSAFTKFQKNYPVDYEDAVQCLAKYNIQEIRVTESGDNYTRVELVDVSDSIFQADIYILHEDSVFVSSSVLLQ